MWSEPLKLDKMSNEKERKVSGYEDEIREKEQLVLKTYEYCLPFNYPNVKVNRKFKGGESHGMELFPIGAVDGEHHPPSDSITITEEEPIIKVVVIGSACTPPGYVTVEAEPTDDFRRPKEASEAMPVRFRIDNLWGMHLRVDLLREEIPYGKLKSNYKELPLSGMSSAVFEIPKSRKVTIKGGSAIGGWEEDTFPDDAHYSFRIIRVTVVEVKK